MRNLVLTSDTDQFVSLRGEADRDRLGKRLRKDMALVSAAIQGTFELLYFDLFSGSSLRMIHPPERSNILCSVYTGATERTFG